MKSRGSLANALIATVAFLAVLVLAVLATRTQTAPQPSVRPTETVVAATPIISPTPTPATSTPSAVATGSGRFGWIVVGGGGLALTDDTGNTVQQHACGFTGRGCSQTMIAVSPDGRRVAFWRTAQGSRWELAMFESATPATVRSIATLPDSFEGQSLAWATDSRGLLFAAQTVGYGGIQGGQGKATVTSIDVTTSAPATDVLPARTDGAFYVPLAWDRSKEIVAAATSGEGGFLFEYVVKVGGSQPKVTRGVPGQLVAYQLQASPDATRILALDRQSNSVKTWPIADFSAQVEVKLGAGGQVNGALWRTSRDVALAYGDKLDVFIAPNESSRMVFTAPSVRLVAMRPDGTAALLFSGGQTNVSAGVIVVDMQSGAVLSRTTTDVAQVAIPRGVTR